MSAVVLVSCHFLQPKLEQEKFMQWKQARWLNMQRLVWDTQWLLHSVTTIPALPFWLLNDHARGISRWERSWEIWLPLAHGNFPQIERPWLARPNCMRASSFLTPRRPQPARPTGAQKCAVCWKASAGWAQWHMGLFPLPSHFWETWPTPPPLPILLAFSLPHQAWVHFPFSFPAAANKCTQLMRGSARKLVSANFLKAREAILLKGNQE